MAYLAPDDLGRQTDDLAEAALAQLAGHRAEDARPARVLVGVDQHQGVAVEPDIAAVVAAGRPAGAGHDGPDHLAPPHLGAGVRPLYAGPHHRPDARIAAAPAPPHPAGP